FVLNAAHRLGVTQRHERANLLAFFLDEVERNLNAAAVLHFHVALVKRLVKFKGFEDGAAQASLAGHEFAHVLSHPFPPPPPTKCSTAALTRIARASRVNSTNPSCRLAMIWSRFSFSAEKTSFTSRICRPRRLILLVTTPTSSVEAPSRSRVSGPSKGPPAIRSRRRAIISSGRSAILERPAARAREIKIAMPEKAMARFSSGASSPFRKTVEMPTRIEPNGEPSRSKGKVISYTRG